MHTSLKPFDPSLFLAGETTVRRVQRKYADLFTPGQRVLDVGCGSGIFLELLRERGVHGIGLDVFEPRLETCRRMGLEVYRSEGIEYFANSHQKFDGVFNSHIVEHLPPQRVLELFKYAYQALNPGGLLIVLTPNCRDIEVMAERFWLDITHVRPYPLALLQKMLEHFDFKVVEIGLDKDSRQRLPKRDPFATINYLLKKIRWGEYFGRGDSFVIARKGGDTR